MWQFLRYILAYLWALLHAQLRLATAWPTSWPHNLSSDWIEAIHTPVVWGLIIVKRRAIYVAVA